MDQLLENKKIAVLLETEYIPSEINYYRQHFSSLGAEVHFMSYLWNKEKMTFISDIDSADKPVKDIQTLEVSIDVSNVIVEEYEAILMAASYCAVRLREIPPNGSFGSIEQIGSPPAVQFFAYAMRNKYIVKGALCHALWILTPIPDLLKGRHVTCHSVVLSDVINAGGIYYPSHVHVDDDLVTARSEANIEEYCDAITKRIIEKQKQRIYDKNKIQA